jgi:hypothetical protein
LHLTMLFHDYSHVGQISGHQQSYRYEDGPWKGRGRLCRRTLIFIFFLIFVLSDLSVLMTT